MSRFRRVTDLSIAAARLSWLLQIVLNWHPLHVRASRRALFALEEFESAKEAFAEAAVLEPGKRIHKQVHR